MASKSELPTAILSGCFCHIAQIWTNETSRFGNPKICEVLLGGVEKINVKCAVDEKNVQNCSLDLGEMHGNAMIL